MGKIIFARAARWRNRRRIAAIASVVLVSGVVAVPAGPANAAANPNPARITGASWWLMEQLLQLQPGSLNGGIYANKPGYHNTRAGNASTNYSVRDSEDKGGPSDKAAAYDWTFPEAQALIPGLDPPGTKHELALPSHVQNVAANYGNISRYSRRLLASAQNPSDPRLDGWREFFGQADNDTSVEGWDFRYGRAASSDSSHLWHIHLSEDRDKVASYENKEALLSVLRGESLAEWLNKAASPMLGYQSETSTIMYRWTSSGSSFGGLSTATHPSLDLSNVGDRFAAGDVDGDGRDDAVLAYQNVDGTFTFKVLRNGSSTPQDWYTSGPFNLAPVANRLVLGDFNDDGRDEPLLGYDSGTGTILYRWLSTGASFSSLSTATHASVDLDNVGGRVAAGDVDNDGRDDTVIAHQNADGRFTYKVFRSGTAAPQDWYTSGSYNLTPVGDRLVLGDFNHDGRDEPLLGYDSGTATILYRWLSTGASFSSLSTATHASVDLDNVDGRIAVGDVDNDGRDDTVIAHQNADGRFTYKVFRSGTAAPQDWYTSGPFDLAPVGDRLVLGSWL